MNLHIDLDWIPVTERLPENGQQIFACVDIDAVDPGEAIFMRTMDKIFAEMSFEQRSIAVGMDQGKEQRVEIFSGRIRPTQFTIAAYAFLHECDDGSFEISLNHFPSGSNWTEINHGYCTTYWAPVPTKGPFSENLD